MTQPTDPSNATASELSRAAFVGITGATLLLGAATPEFGSVHPPIVSDDDPEIIISRPMLHSNGAQIDTFAVAPINATAKTPCVVLSMHIWGVDTSMRDVAKRLAKHGYASICPNLYARQHAPSGDGATDFKVFYPFMKALVRSEMDADFAAASAWLRAQYPKAKQATLGFCMGGHHALQQTIDNANDFSAVVAFYGAVEGIDPKLIGMPVCGSYGERDTSIPAQDVRAFAAGLHVSHDIKIYPEAGHAFFDDQRTSYVASAAADAWHRTLIFLGKYLHTA